MAQARLWPPYSLLLLRADPLDALDRQRRAAGFFGDLAVLLDDEAARGLVAFEAAKQLGRHAPVGTLRAVLIDDIEKGELALGIGSGFLGHARLVVDQGADVKVSKQINGVRARCLETIFIAA